MGYSVAAVQMETRPFAVEDNLSRATSHVRRACSEGAEVVVLPELFNTGYCYDKRLLEHREPIGGRTTQWMQDHSRREKVYLAACLAEEAPYGCYDTLVLTSPCGTIHTYRKRYPAFFEKLYFSAGHSEGIFRTAIGRIGVMVCWDMVQPRLLREMKGRIDLLLISSAWPDMTTGNIPVPLFSKWMSRQPAFTPARLANELGVPVVYANKAGQFRTRIPFLGFAYEASFAGGSSITNHAGETVQSQHRGDDVLVARLEFSTPHNTPRALRLYRGEEERGSRRAAA